MIEAMSEVGSWGGVGIGVAGVANTVLLVDKNVVLLSTNIVPLLKMPLYHFLLNAVMGPLGLARVAVLTWTSRCWEHVALVWPRVTPQPWMELKNLCTILY